MAGGLARRRACPHPYGAVTAARVALGTNVFPPLLKKTRKYVVPVYDYVMVTEPLSEAQMESIGWSGREGIADSGNQFHYYRLTSDNSILWGGYDTIYNFRGKVRREYEFNSETYATLAGHFLKTFPQLAGIKFTHAWGGPSTRALGSRRSGERRTRTKWPTSSATPGSESPRPGSAPRRCSICWTDSRPTALD